MTYAHQHEYRQPSPHQTRLPANSGLERSHLGENPEPPEHPKPPGSKFSPDPHSCLPNTTDCAAPINEEAARSHAYAPCPAGRSNAGHGKRGTLDTRVPLQGRPTRAQGQTLRALDLVCESAPDLRSEAEDRLGAVLGVAHGDFRAAGCPTSTQSPDPLL